MITIIGSGRVGSSTAMRIAEMGLDDVLLLDIVEGLARGEALDISQSCVFDVNVSGSEDFGDMRGSDIVINAAGLARKPGMDRLGLMSRNKEITSSVAGKIKRFAPGSIVIQVANPMDVMSLVQLRETGFEREKVIGMGGVLDSQRFSYFISRRFSVPPSKVEALVIGEHGDSMVPLVSHAKVDGRPLSEIADQGDIGRLIDMTRKAGAEVIELKGSTFYAPARAIALMAEAVARDKKAVLPASVYLQGEYGVSGICAGVPARIGRDGLEGIVEIDITDEEKRAFSSSCDLLRRKAGELGLL
ncbi:MAG: malate dehydrogenase [Candidatus Aenigmarchaeota archaeon]|nr:malate dehydrogenase [Candidatus Aenigmarchaeota archaeon]